MQSSSSSSSSSIPAKKKLDRAVQSSGMKTVAVFNRLHESKTGNDALAAKKKLNEEALQSSSMAALILVKQESDRAVQPSGTKTAAVSNRLHLATTGNDALVAKKTLKEEATQISSMAASILTKQNLIESYDLWK